MAAGKITVGVNYSRLQGSSKLPWKELYLECSYMKPGYQFAKSFQEKRWDGMVHLMDRDGKFPSGLIDRVLKVLDKYGMPIEIESHVQYPEKRYPWYLKDGIIDRERHLEAIAAVVAGKRGVVQLPTRFGKTTKVAAGTIASFGVPTLFIAHQLDLIYDAKSVFESFIDGVGDIGVIGGGETTIGPLTVACIDSLANRIKDDPLIARYLTTKVQYLIVDETQFYGPGEYKDVVSNCCAPYRLFMSATPERNDGADLEIEAASGGMLYCLNEEAMIEEGYISDVDVEMIPFDHGLYNSSSTGIKYNEFYDEFIVKNEARNQLIVDEVCKLVAVGNPSLIIVKAIEHGHILKELLLAKGLRTEFVWGECSVPERRKIREDFNAGGYDVLIGSTIFDTAIDLRRASGLVLAASGSSKIRAPQRVGRTLSYVMGKTAFVKDIKDMNIKYFSNDARERQDVYIGRYGDSRVHVRGRQDLSEIEKMLGIDCMAMFDSLK